MNDNEITKILKCCSKEDCENCSREWSYNNQWACMRHIMRLSLDLHNCQKAEIEKDEKIIKAADGLIEAQKAEIENLTKVAEQQQSVAMDRYFEIERLKAEIERLTEENKVLDLNRRMALLEKESLYDCIKKTTTEAVKEFAERLKEKAYTNNYCEEVVREAEINNILKEGVMAYIDRDKIPYYLDTSEEAPMEGRKIAFKSDIDKIPTADVVEVKHGEWQEERWCDNFQHTCSLCHSTVRVHPQSVAYKYCPYCGARMDGRSETNAE